MNANKEYVPQAFLLDENSQFLLKRLLDSATEELLARQHKVLAQAQLGLPSKAGLTKQVVDSIERIETQLSAFQFCSTGRGDRTARPCKSHSGVTPTEEEEDYYLSSVIPFQRSMEPRQSYLRNRQMSRQTTRTSSVAPSLRSLNNNATVMILFTCHVKTAITATRPLRSVGFEKPIHSNRTSQEPRLEQAQKEKNKFIQQKKPLGKQQCQPLAQAGKLMLRASPSQAHHIHQRVIMMMMRTLESVILLPNITDQSFLQNRGKRLLPGGLKESRRS